MKKAIIFLLSLGSLCGYRGAVAQVYALPRVPAAVPVPLRILLADDRAALSERLDTLRSQAGRFNTKCSSVPSQSPEVQTCRNEQARLESKRTQFNRDARRFQQELVRARTQTPRSAVIWAGAENLVLTRAGHQDPVYLDQPLHSGDCVKTTSQGAILSLPGVVLKLKAGETFCYAPQHPRTLQGVIGRLIRYLANGPEMIPIESCACVLG